MIGSISKADVFATITEHRLRAKWPKLTIKYSGGGWYEWRSDPFMPPIKKRREELKNTVKVIREEGKNR